MSNSGSKKQRIERACKYALYLYFVNGWEWYKCVNAAIAQFNLYP